MDTTQLIASFSRNPDLQAAGPVNIRTKDGVLIASVFNPDNGRDNVKDAAELVRRYNSFPALVEALEGLLKALGDGIEVIRYQPSGDDAIYAAEQALEDAKAQ
jgi:hypothetical protein